MGEAMRLAHLLLLVLATGAISIAPAQPYQKHHFTAGLGVAAPRDQINPPFRNAFSWSFGYGYRPWKYLQFDAALDTAYNAADVDEYLLDPAFGYLRVRDFEYFVPLGARLVAPFKDNRFSLYGGGGGAYVRYSESLRQPSEYYNVACPSCRSRDGWGYYFLAGGDVALTDSGRFRIGVTTRVYQVTTDGRGVGQLPAVETRDRWINTYGHVTFSF